MSGEHMPGWAVDAFDDGRLRWRADGALIVMPYEGVKVSRGAYWVIRGLEGELSPCKASVFEAKYEQNTVGADA